MLESGSANSFSTYLLTLGVLAMIVLHRDVLRELDWPLTSLVGVFLGYLALSAAWSDSGDASGKLLGHGLLVLGFCLSIFIAIKRYRWFAYWLVLLTILAAVISCGYSLYLHYVLDDYQPLPEPRLFAMGRLSNPVVSAFSYGFATILCCYMAMTRQRWVARLVFAEIALLFLGAIVLTGSRGAWPALAVGLSAGMLVQYPGNRKYQLLGIAGSVMLLGTIMLVFLGPELIMKRALSLRPDIWLEFIGRTLAGNPLIGAGMTSDTTFQHPAQLVDHPHSVYVATFYYGGVIGLLLLLLLIARSLDSIWRLDNPQHKLLATMVIGFGLTAILLDGNELLTKVNFLWLVFWLPVGLALLRKTSVGARQAISDHEVNHAARHEQHK